MAHTRWAPKLPSQLSDKLAFKNSSRESLHSVELESSDSHQKVTSTKEPESVSNQFPHGFRLVLLVAAVMLTVFLTSLDQTIVGTAIPKITDDFRGLSQVSWYGSAYFMCLGGFQSSWGKAFKYFPLKSTFLTSILLFEIGSLICGIAPNSNVFIVGRALAGVGGAGVSTGGTIVLAFSTEPEKRPLLMTFVGVSYTIASICGPVMGGVFTQRLTWRWCFYINLPLGGTGLAILAIFFHTPPSAKPLKASWKEKFLQMDPLGIALTMGCFISFILALQYGGQSHAWSSSVVICLLVAFVTLLLTLIAWEICQGDYAMLPPRLLKRRALWAGCLFQLFFSGSYFILLYYIPLFFQSINEMGAIKSSLSNMPLFLACCFGIITGGMTVTKTHQAAPFMVIGSALASATMGLVYMADAETSEGMWVVYQLLLGLVLAFPFQNAINIAHADADPEDVPTVSSTIYFFQVLGGAFSTSAAQSAFVNRLVSSVITNAPEANPQQLIFTGATELRSVFPPEQLPGVLQAYLDGIKASFAVAIGMTGISFVISLMVPWKRLHTRTESDATHAASSNRLSFLA
ncbi:hypothetical protein HYFRA_00004459 [Hymenoscyphus fraxineus]|uniref:Major facilitator superfamily (MFS) profile domain-containing protein n=1 Tax=Hymenoscyphus fraxineus TaxID=746836 RepID=A0A9N9PIK1_9HELO|nr:hypothetical protein HYFRA_00004459 [Hymenoscyphus fraxineus]